MTQFFIPKKINKINKKLYLSVNHIINHQN